MIYLRPFEPDDYKLINKWRNDKELHKLTGGVYFYISGESDRNWVAEKMKFSVKEVYAAICLKETNEMIGYTSLSQIDPIHRKCVWSGIVIGADIGKGKNVGFQVGVLILGYAFNSLNMNRITGTFFDSNVKTAKMVTKLGFKVEGTARNSLFKHGIYHNEVYIGLLRREFEEMLGRTNQENPERAINM
jgi:RimJ/RimL family protein N-acetyltransferase